MCFENGQCVWKLGRGVKQSIETENHEIRLLKRAGINKSNNALQMSEEHGSDD